ncbi:MAG: hypothetical protein CL666_14555 [Balneola sp.]|nr:hypothetical protein [Balneola sp.]|tara:strand:+ start:55158 stop:55424 length:267 start_codon:yes stop_codon:yes gene_type:complete
MSISKIIRKVCEAFDVKPSDIISSSRKQPIADARKAISFISLTKGHLPPSIAGFIDKERSTVLYQIKRHRELMTHDSEYKKKVEAVEL